MLSATKLATTDATEIYECPSNKKACVTISGVALASCTLSYFLTDGSAPTDKNIFENLIALEPSGSPLVRGGIWLDAGDKLFAQTDTVDGAALQVWGFLEDAT